MGSRDDSLKGEYVIEILWLNPSRTLFLISILLNYNTQ